MANNSENPRKLNLRLRNNQIHTIGSSKRGGGYSNLWLWVILEIKINVDVKPKENNLRNCLDCLRSSLILLSSTRSLEFDPLGKDQWTGKIPDMTQRSQKVTEPAPTPGRSQPRINLGRLQSLNPWSQGRSGSEVQIMHQWTPWNQAKAACHLKSKIFVVLLCPSCILLLFSSEHIPSINYMHWNLHHRICF